MSRGHHPTQRPMTATARPTSSAHPVRPTAAGAPAGRAHVQSAQDRTDRFLSYSHPAPVFHAEPAAYAAAIGLAGAPAGIHIADSVRQRWPLAAFADAIGRAASLLAGLGSDVPITLTATALAPWQGSKVGIAADGLSLDMGHPRDGAVMLLLNVGRARLAVEGYPEFAPRRGTLFPSREHEYLNAALWDAEIWRRLAEEGHAVAAAHDAEFGVIRSGFEDLRAFAAARGHRVAPNVGGMAALYLEGTVLVPSDVPGERLAWRAHVRDVLPEVARLGDDILHAVRGREALRTPSDAGVALRSVARILRREHTGLSVTVPKVRIDRWRGAAWPRELERRRRPDTVCTPA